MSLVAHSRYPRPLDSLRACIARNNAGGGRFSSQTHVRETQRTRKSSDETNVARNVESRESIRVRFSWVTCPQYRSFQSVCQSIWSLATHFAQHQIGHNAVWFIHVFCIAPSDTSHVVCAKHKNIATVKMKIGSTQFIWPNEKQAFISVLTI